MNAVATPSKTRARARPAGPAAPAAAPFHAQAAWKSIAELLDAAYQTDETHERSGDSDRLLRIASEMASRAAEPDFFRELVAEDRLASEMAFHAFDIAALINAARLVPGDTESITRRGYIDAAAKLLQRLAGTTTVDAMIFTDVPRPAAREPKPLTRETSIQEGGALALRLVTQACWDVSYVASAALDRADELEQEHYAVMRCFCARILELNYLLMSYLTDDDVTLNDAHRTVYGKDAVLPEGELKP